MTAIYVADLKLAISDPRLENYRPHGGGDIEMVVNYFWNIELSKALYPCLSALEISLRNGIHNAVASSRNTDMWFQAILKQRQLKAFQAAQSKLSHRNQTNPTAGQIVAELHFGFWTALLTQPYHQKLWAPNNAALLHAAFPHLSPTPNARRHIHQRYNHLRLLRNRVMHHEPIWHRTTLQQDHKDAVEAIGWVNQTKRDTVTQLDTFPDELANGRARVESTIKQILGLP